MENNRPDKDMTDVEWENRRLCNDGNCIGVIGEDGRCKECGKPYDESLDEKCNSLEEDDSGGKSFEQASADDREDIPLESGEDEWENRRLCIDGNCIGVIGPDGNCKECGKPYED